MSDPKELTFFDIFLIREHFSVCSIGAEHPRAIAVNYRNLTLRYKFANYPILFSLFFIFSAICSYSSFKLIPFDSGNIKDTFDRGGANTAHGKY